MRLPIAFTIAFTIAGATLAAPAVAEPLDRLFSGPGIAQLPEGRTLLYRHRRADGHHTGGQRAFERTVRLARDTDKASVLATLEGDGAARPLAAFRGTTGNPIALLFVDSVVGRVSEASGGNPFYLRNRIKEAMQARSDGRPVSVRHGGAEVAGQEVTLRPFAGDPHADELGLLAALELTIVLSDSVPGGFVSLRTRAGAAPGGYLEEILLHGTT